MEAPVRRLGGTKLRVGCPICSTMCEVTIPASHTEEKPVRFHIRCPGCRQVHDPMRAAAPAVKKTKVPRVHPQSAKPPALAPPPAPSPPPAPAQDPPPAQLTAQPKRKAAPSPAEPPREVRSLPEPSQGVPPPVKIARASNSRQDPSPPPSSSAASAATVADVTNAGSGGGGRSSQTEGKAKAAIDSKDGEARCRPQDRPAPSSLGSSAQHEAAARGGKFAARATRHSAPPGPPSAGADAPADAPGPVAAGGGGARLSSARQGLSSASRAPKYAPFGWQRELAAPPSCDEAFELAQGCLDRRGRCAEFRPQWRAGDAVEVSWAGKGHEGSWADGDVVSLDGPTHTMVRFRDFVDHDGSALVERIEAKRLRLVPAERRDGWGPEVGDAVEGKWNDCWWEGRIRELSALKGVLFEYDRYTNWTWLPPRAVRERPPLWSYYKRSSYEADEPDASMDASRSSKRLPEGACGHQGCPLPNNHPGLCQIRAAVRESRRAGLQEKVRHDQQARLWEEIVSKREVAARLANARADSLREAEKAGTSIVAPRGHKAQWHANFKLDEFSAALRELRVLALPTDDDGQGGAVRDAASGGEGELRGMVVVGQGNTLADLAHMLRTELGFRRDAEVACVLADGTWLRLSGLPQHLELTRLLPQGECELRVRDPRAEQCAVLRA